MMKSCVSHKRISSDSHGASNASMARMVIFMPLIRPSMMELAPSRLFHTKAVPKRPPAAVAPRPG
jgi:hypothetical protein